MKTQNNKYDYILIMMIALLAFGNYGNGAQPVRLFILLLAPIMFVGAIRRPSFTAKYYKYECFFLAFWWMWSLAFLYKSQDMAESAKHVVYLLVHVVGFLEVFWLANKSSNPQRSLQKGWILLLLITLPIAFHEYITDQHMSNSYIDSGAVMKIGGVSVERPFAAVTFGNLNSYNTVLCWSLPSLFFFNLYPRKKYDHIIGYLLLFFITVIVVANASRGAILCLGALLVTFVYSYYKTGRNRVALTVAIGIIIVVMAYFLFDLFFVILKRFSSQGIQDTGRLENIVKGTQALFDTCGLGIGIGNYAPVMSGVYGVRIAAPHNLLLEVGVCFGLPVLIGFVGMLLRICYKGVKGCPANKSMMLSCMMAILLAGVVDSNYLMKVPTWMFIATAYIYVDRKYNSSSTNTMNI